jgi:hypothetical protein
MRFELKPFLDKRLTFKATFQKYGRKNGWKSRILPTVLLVDVFVEFENQTQPVSDHIWLNCGKQLFELELKAGDILHFDARVQIYQKGYAEEDSENPIRFDYGLCRPSKINKIGRSEKDYSRFDELNKTTIETILQLELQRQKAIENYVQKKENPAIVEEEKKEKESLRPRLLFSDLRQFFC